MSLRPIPIPQIESKPFWDAVRDHRLVMQYCADCGKLNWFPRGSCAFCGHEKFDWKECAGTGTLETFSIVYRPMSDAWKGEVPYIVAIVKLDEGPRMVTRIVRRPDREPQMDARVRVTFVPIEDGWTLPYFEEID